MEAPTYLGLLKQKITKWHGFAYGYGVISNLAHAYSFLMDNYRPGDSVYLIGFSRGAFTVRVLCTLLYEFGLLEKGNQALIEYMMTLFINPNRATHHIAKNFKATFGRACVPHFVGVWDTVSSVGWVYDPLIMPFSKENPGFNIGRQAISIDERRCFFRTNLWHQSAPTQDLKQVWFAGVHCDVGGSYPDRESGLSNIALEWMLNEAEAAGLLVDHEAKEKLFSACPPDPHALMHESLVGWWWIPEYLPKPYIVREGDHYKKKLRVYAGRRRLIPEGAYLHKSVIERMSRPENNYRPTNLPQHYHVTKN